MTKIAVIGSGMAALALANQLPEDADVTIFEKSYKPGGRLSTRRLGDTPIDFGAQFFTVTDPRFREFLKPALNLEIIQPWVCQFAEISLDGVNKAYAWDNSKEHFVGSPTMRSLADFYAGSLNVIYNTRITAIEKDAYHWCLLDDNGHFFKGFDWVVSTAPLDQTETLFSGATEKAFSFESTPMQGCFALMLVLKTPAPVDWQAACVKSEKVSWVSICSSKPNRVGNPSAVVLSTNRFADQFLDADIEWVRDQLLADGLQLLNLSSKDVEMTDIHRWRYANTPKQSGPQFYCDPENALAACGDWCIQGRLESSFLSGFHCGQYLKELIYERC